MVEGLAVVEGGGFMVGEMEMPLRSHATDDPGCCWAARSALYRRLNAVLIVVHVSLFAELMIQLRGDSYGAKGNPDRHQR